MTKTEGKYQEINEEGLTILSDFTEDVPVFMMNYLKYKEIVCETGKTGRETYRAYLEAAIPFFNQLKAEIIFKGKPIATIIGLKDEKLWDEVLIVKYLNKNEFFKLLKMKNYPRELRVSSLSDSKLIFCK
ncbi:MAG: Uncharacterised protein [Polaribacter sp. SA4-10]|nr:MAG: Uncharacterised protein [Polaribacter sp. SA4-10]